MKTSVIGVFCLLTGLATGTVHADEQAPPVLIDTGASHIGLPFEQIIGRPIHAAKSGSMLLVLSPHEQATFSGGKLVRYMCIEGEDRQCRAKTSPAASQQFSFNEAKGEKWRGMGLRILDAEYFAARPGLRPPSAAYALTHVDGKPYTVAYDAQNHVYNIIEGQAL